MTNIAATSAKIGPPSSFVLSPSLELLDALAAVPLAVPLGLPLLLALPPPLPFPLLFELIPPKCFPLIQPLCPVRVFLTKFGRELRTINVRAAFG